MEGLFLWDAFLHSGPEGADSSAEIVPVVSSIEKIQREPIKPTKFVNDGLQSSSIMSHSATTVYLAKLPQAHLGGCALCRTLNIFHGHFSSIDLCT